MGFSHTWHLNRAYLPKEWASLEADAVTLSVELPKEMRRQYEARQAQRPWISRLIVRSARLIAPESVPMHPGFPLGYTGPSQGEAFPGARCIRFAGAPLGSALLRNEIEITNAEGSGWGRTNAQPHDRALIALLCRAELLRPGNVSITHTDGDEEHWTESVAWAQRAFGCLLPMPSGLACSESHNARFKALTEAATLEEIVPASKARLGPSRI